MEYIYPLHVRVSGLSCTAGHFSPNKIMDMQVKEYVMAVRDGRNSVPLDHCLSSLNVPRDRYFYQLVTLMIDYFLAHQIRVSTVARKFFLPLLHM